MKPARLDLVGEAAEYLADHPDASANAVVAALACKRVDGLAAVLAVKTLSRLPGEPLRWFLKPSGGSDADRRAE